MSWEISYKSKWSGKEEIHCNTNNESDAIGWAKNLSAENNYKAVCTHIADGPYDRSSKKTHIASFGDN